MKPPLSIAEMFIREITKKGWVSVSIQGKLAKVHVISNVKKSPVSSKRGEITWFSRKARLRMLSFSATVAWGKIPKAVFITLTYPDQRMKRMRKQMNRDKYLFLRAMEKHLGKNVCGLWRLEWKERQSGMCVGEIAPHWHIMLMNVAFIPKETVTKEWRKILKVKGPLCTRVDGLKNGQICAAYIAKYCAKPQDTSGLDYLPYLHKTGRHYGYIRKAMIPREPVKWFRDLDAEAIAAIFHLGVETLPWIRIGDPQSFRLLGGGATLLEFILLQLGLVSNSDPVYKD